MIRAQTPLAVLVLAAALVAPTRPSLAQTHNLFDGQAEVRLSGDRQRVRDRALDDALRMAVQTAATSIFGEDGIKQKSSELRLRVLPKAKSYVLSYRISTEDEENGVYVLRLVADVNLEQLSRDLTTSVAAPPPPAATGPLAVCITTGTAAQAERALVRWRALRIASKLAQPDGGCPATFPADQSLLMIELQARPEGTVRGTTLVTATVEGKARLAKAGVVEASLSATQIGWGPDATQAEDAAIDRVADKLGLQLVPFVGPRIGASLPLVDVRVAWKRSWPEVALLLKALQQTAGVDRAAVKAVSPSLCTVEVEGTLSAAALLAALERSPLIECKGKVVAGNQLDLEVARRAPPAPTPGG